MKTPRISKENLYRWISCLVLALGIGLRFFNLEADPPFWMEHCVPDEATYVQNARNKFLFDQWIIDEHNQGLYACPLLTGLEYLSLRFFGLSFWSFHFFPALLGSLSLILFYQLIKKYLKPQQTLLATFFFSFSSLYLHFSRVALGEVFFLFFLLYSLFFWMKATSPPYPKRVLFSALSGFFFGLALLSKIAAFNHITVFFILWLFQWRRGEIRLKDPVLFFAGFSLSLPPWGILHLLTQGQWWQYVSGFSSYNFLGSKIPIISYLLNIHLYLTNWLFGSHPILWILFLGYLLWLIHRILVQKQGMKDFNSMEVMSLALFLGGFFASFWSSYQPEQRILSSIWSLSILASLLLTHEPPIKIKFDQIFQAVKDRPSWQGHLLTCLAVFPLWFFLAYVISGRTEKIPIILWGKPGLSLLKVSVLFFPLWITGCILSYRKKMILRIFLIGSVVALLFFGMSPLLLNLQIFFGIGVDQVLHLDLWKKQIGLLMLPILLAVCLISCRWFKEVVVWRASSLRMGTIIIIFFLFHFWLGILPIVNPTYTIRKMADDLAKEPGLKRVYSVSFYYPLLLTRARLITVFSNNSFSLNIKDYLSSRESFALNLVDKIPKGMSEFNINYLVSWEKEFPLPPGRRLVGIYEICPFGLTENHRYTLALWKY
jgi:hypothetical protein